MKTKRSVVILIALAVLMLVGAYKFRQVNQEQQLKTAIASMKEALTYEIRRKEAIDPTFIVWPPLRHSMFPGGGIPRNPFGKAGNDVTMLMVPRNLNPDDGENNGGWIYNLYNGEIRPDSYLYFKYGY